MKPDVTRVTFTRHDGESVRVPRWATQVDWSMSDLRISERIGVSRSTVTRLRSLMGQPPSPFARHGQRTPSVEMKNIATGHPVLVPEWAAKVDWATQSDREIAAHVEVSRARVSTVRHRLGYTTGKGIGVKERLRRWEYIKKHAANETVQELAQHTGYSMYRVRDILTELGLKAKPAQRSRKGLGRYDWSKVDWGKTNKQIAAELGCATQTVANYRHREGKPPAPRGSRRAV